MSDSKPSTRRTSGSQLKGCPFGIDHNTKVITLGKSGRATVVCEHENCCIGPIGQSILDAILKWNHRDRCECGKDQ